MPLMVFFVVLLILLAAIPLDGGMTLVLLRQAQGGADAAAQGGAAALSESCFTENTPPPGTVYDIIQQVLASNTPGGEPSALTWSARYLDDTGHPLGLVNATTSPPNGACGVTVEVGTTRSNGVAGLLGFGSLSTSANAAAKLRPSGGVRVLSEYGRHTFYAKSHGTLEVDGNLYLLSRGCKWVGDASPLSQPDAYRNVGAGVTDSSDAGTQTWDSCAPGTDWNGRSVLDACVGCSPPQGAVPYWGEDLIDTFEDVPGVSLKTQGSVYSVTQRPLDPWFYCLPNGVHNHAGDLWAVKNAPPSQRLCSASYPGAGSVESLRFQGITPGDKRLNDPLQNLSPPSAQPQTYCPNGAVNPMPQFGSDGKLHYFPGTYTYPVVIGGRTGIARAPNATSFADTHADVVLNGCSINPSNPNAADYPGIYVFKQGVEICPENGNSVSSQGPGVMLYSAGPFGGPGPVNVPAGGYPGCPGEGKATPFTDHSGDFCPQGPGVCWENDDQVMDAGYYGSGTYGITIGGHGNVTLNAPTSGPYNGILLFQDRADGQGANGYDDRNGHNPNPGIVDGTSPYADGANIGLDPYPGVRADAAHYNPNCNNATNPACSSPNYHDNFYEPAASAHDPNAADNSNINLTGILYDAYAPLTGGGATQLAKTACSNHRTYGNLPGCYLKVDGGSKDQPTPGASLQPAALYANPLGGPAVKRDCTSLPASCQTQLAPGDLWRVLCEGTAPTSNAGRIQIGQSTCSDDPYESNAIQASCPGSDCGTVTITGAAIADVFDTTGGINAVIDVQAPSMVDLISAPPP
jgi:hypothetical protein